MTKLISKTMNNFPIYKKHVNGLVNHAISTGKNPNLADTMRCQMEIVPALLPLKNANFMASTATDYGHNCVAAARWATCKQVYRFDHDFAKELARQGLPNEIPTSPLSALPYPIIFVSVSFNTLGFNMEGECVPASCCGFAAWADAGMPGQPDSVVIMPIGKDADTSHPSQPTFRIPLSEITFTDYFDALFGNIKKQIEIPCQQEAGFEETLRKAYEETLSMVVNCLLFILADNADVKTVFIPKHGPCYERMKMSPLGLLILSPSRTLL